MVVRDKKVATVIPVPFWDRFIFFERSVFLCIIPVFDGVAEYSLKIETIIITVMKEI